MSNPFERKKDVSTDELEEILGNGGSKAPPLPKMQTAKVIEPELREINTNPFNKRQDTSTERPNPFSAKRDEDSPKSNPFNKTERDENPFQRKPSVEEDVKDDDIDISRKARGFSGNSPIDRRLQSDGSLRDELNVPRRPQGGFGEDRRGNGFGRQQEGQRETNNSGGVGALPTFLGISAGAIAIIVAALLVAGFLFNFYSNKKQEDALERSVNKVSNFYVTDEAGNTKLFEPGDTPIVTEKETRYLDFIKENRKEIRVYVDEYTTEIVERKTKLKDGKIEAIVTFNPEIDQILTVEYLSIVE